MGNYSIVRDGNEYVVRAGEKSVLKIASRRRAAKLISDAVELLEKQPAPSAEVENTSIVPDLGAILDSQVP
ncbi:hypothetical protein [Afipia sp. GAS231]|uniref:hypothetical protein n=1 Tax=Afipia sp. GAS231 TaxID=1882747 RepID=UPI001FCCC7E6|nr:hypothetical protein [Afipia sp. GAS231]